MSGRAPDPRRLDVATLAAAGVVLEGRWPLAGFARLPDAATQAGDVTWSLQASLRRRAGGGAEPWLALSAAATVRLVCQRCLQHVEVPLQVARDFRFVADEALAAALDAEADEDVLALPQRLDLHALLEDELLLTLPLVPRHERCPQPLTVPSTDFADPGVDAAAATAERAHPFAALAALKAGKPPQTH